MTACFVSRDYLMLDVFADIPGITCKSMFGGFSFYKDGIIFACIADGVLYFKVDDIRRQRAHSEEKEGEPIMNYWLIKSEPSCFSIDDMKKKHIDSWDGVRNYTARNFMKEMQVGDLCFFYHSNAKKTGIVGLVKVVKMAYPDPADIRFVCVDVEYQKSLPFLSLHFLKTIPLIHHLPLFHQSRLSVQPVDKDAADVILNLTPN